MQEIPRLRFGLRKTQHHWLAFFVYKRRFYGRAGRGLTVSELGGAHSRLKRRTAARQASRDEIASMQLIRLNELLAQVVKRPFYREKLCDASLPLTSLDDLQQLPLLTKQELETPRGREMSPAKPLAPGAIDRASALHAAGIFDLPRDDYVRFHQTSGTRGWPMPVLDTADDWQWWLECWQYVLDAADITSGDVAMMAFSFGPFIGFWTAHDALVSRGAMVIPGGGMSSEARLKLILSAGCTVLCCTPTYAMHLANVAQSMGINLSRESQVRRIIVAGEPGGSVASVRKRIETAWGAALMDHSGASEIGAWGFGCIDESAQAGDNARCLGLHVIESEFIAECLVFDAEGSPRRAVDGELAELVLTSLGRHGGPVIRYRTGDMVRGIRDHDRDCRFLWLDGGVLGRCDDMMVIRGVNVFPSSIEAIVREVVPAAEYRLTARRRDEMDQLELEIEAEHEVSQTLGELLRDRLSMRVQVRVSAPGSLPLYEAKSRRWIDLRKGE